MKKIAVVLVALAICTLASQNAMAQSRLGLKAVGAQVGIVSPQDIDNTLGLGGLADWGRMAPNLRLVTSVDFWSKSVDTFNATSTVGDVELSARGEYMFPVASPRVQPYMGAGLGMHMLHAKVEVPGLPTLESSTTRLGLDLGGGFEMPVSPRTQFRSELWYGIVDGYNQLSVKAGLAFKIGA